LGLGAAGWVLAAPRLEAWHHFRAARSALRSYHNPQAIRHLQACLRTWPSDPDVLLLSARAARRARAYGEAERCLEQYQQARGLDDAGSFEQLLLSAERNVDQVAPVCRRHVEQGHPNTPLILEALARGYMRQYRLGEARFCLDRWLEEQPDNAQAHCLDGEFHLDYEHARALALESYRRAVELDPDHEEARQGLAITLLESKAYAEAAEQLEYLLTLQPDNLRLEVGLAECRYNLGDLADAACRVDHVLAQQPDSARALALRGRLLIQRGEYAEAESCLRRAVALTPGNHQAQYDLLLTLRCLSKGAEAERQWKEIVRLEEDLKRFNEIVTREMTQRPRDPALHCALGQLLLRGGHTEEGLRWLQSALRLDPGYAPARKALAEQAQKARDNPGQPD
jgi:tetratricopeptide (TPR) repeat protein